MKITPHADQCLSFISCQLNPETQRRFAPSKRRPSITISRQIGCGSMAIAGELCALMEAQAGEPCHWTVIDKNLVEKVLDEHKLPKEVAKFMQEGRVSAIQDAIEEILGLHPSSRTLWQQTSETILHLAELGQVIVMGRAAHVITRHMNQVFHVRLIAPLEVRVQQIMARDQLDHKAALKLVQQVDSGRRRYLQDHFHTDIDDSLQYDLVINTARLPLQAVARLIAAAVQQWAKTL